jgi:hypothetical protein
VCDLCDAGEMSVGGGTDRHGIEASMKRARQDRKIGPLVVGSSHSPMAEIR